MTSNKSLMPALTFYALTPGRWGDFETLFGEHGAYGGCWCMWWRLTRAQFTKQEGDQNRQAMKGIVESGEVPGILAYANDEPVGLCSVAPRQAFPSLNRSPKLKKVDDEPVWAIVCFFVAKRFRRKGLMRELIKAAVEQAKKNGGKVVEGYPVEPQATLSGFAGYMGVTSAFREAGFVEVLRRAEHQPIMRYVVEDR